MSQCGYPECTEKATITYALVPLCIHHYTKVSWETMMYYERRLDRYADRRHLLRINHLIPWRNKTLNPKRWKGPSPK